MSIAKLDAWGPWPDMPSHVSATVYMAQGKICTHAEA